MKITLSSKLLGRTTRSAVHPKEDCFSPAVGWTFPNSTSVWNRMRHRVLPGTDQPPVMDSLCRTTKGPADSTAPSPCRFSSFLFPLALVHPELHPPPPLWHALARAGGAGQGRSRETTPARSGTMSRGRCPDVPDRPPPPARQ